MKYHTIVADPPWPYDNANRGSPWRSVKVDGSLAIGVAEWTYQPMNLDAICALPVEALAEQHAHLYLWTTNAFMEQAHVVARSWGFTPRTILTWGKVHQDERSRVSMKTGHYFRGATEHVVFAVRGSQPTRGTWPTLYLWPRIGEHSVKPDAFYDLVEAASPGPYVELFARRHRFFWDVWGNESANTAQLGVNE